MPAVPPSVARAVKAPSCQTNARLPAYPTTWPASLRSLACALWILGSKTPRSVTAYGPGGAAARGGRVTIDGSNSSASMATSGLRIKAPSHGATAKANDVPPMCTENALLDKGLSTREATIRLPLMKRVTREERSVNQYGALLQLGLLAFGRRPRRLAIR